MKIWRKSLSIKTRQKDDTDDGKEIKNIRAFIYQEIAKKNRYLFFDAKNTGGGRDMSIKFNYYYGKEADQFSFFRIPKLLFTDPIFASLSSDAKVLYGILLDRMNLSMKNNWIDEENKVYIIFTIEEIAEIMCCATQKATKILQELDDKKGIGLVEKKRLGLGKPNILYVKNFILQEGKDKKEKTHIQEETINQELLKSQFKNDENHNSGNVNFTNQELCKSQCNMD